MNASAYSTPQHILDTGRLSWGIEEEHVYTCPCGSWQLHVPKDIVMGFVGYVDTLGESEWIYDAIRALNAAMNDALWEHEAECRVLQHAAVQAGVVRGEPFHPYAEAWRPSAEDAAQAEDGSDF